MWNQLYKPAQKIPPFSDELFTDKDEEEKWQVTSDFLLETKSLKAFFDLTPDKVYAPNFSRSKKHN